MSSSPNTIRQVRQEILVARPFAQEFGTNHVNIDPSDVQALFARHYFYFAALATLGTLQIAVATGGHRGLWLTPSRNATRLIGILLICTGIALFFLMPLWVEGPWATGSVAADSATREWGKANWQDLGAARNVNDINGGLSGTGQATWFPLGALIAFVVSVGAGTANRKLFPGRMNQPVERPDGTDGIALTATHSYFDALKISWRRFRVELPSEASRLLALSDRWSISVAIWRRFHR